MFPLKIPRYLQLPNTCFADVGNLFSTTAFNKGSVILARGQTAESLFVVAGGTIGVYHEDDGFQAEHLSPVAILTPGQMFGESVVINSGLPSYATYRVAGEGPSNMFILDTSALCTLLLNHEEWRIPMAKAVQRAYTLSRMSEEVCAWLSDSSLFNQR